MVEISFDMSFIRSEALSGVEVMRLRSSGSLPPRRASGMFVLETMVEGALDEYYQRAVHRLVPGHTYLVNAEEIFGPVARHSETVELVAVLIDPARLEAAVNALLGYEMSSPSFRRFVAEEPRLAPAVLGLVRLVTEGAPRDAQERALGELFQLLIPGECNPAPLMQPVTPRSENIRKVRDYLRDRFAEKISLEDLEGVAGLSRFHLLRRFRAEVGVPPHTYQVLVRVERAREFIRRGMPPVNVAGAVGFADQSHLTRHFKRRVGMTPGAYARRVVGTSDGGPSGF